MFGIGKKKVRTEEELKEAIKNEEDTIEIIGDLKNKIIKIKAKGKVSLILGIGLILIGGAATILSGGSAAPATIPSMAMAKAAFLLPPAAAAAGGGSLGGLISALGIGSVGTSMLNSLKKYEIKEETDKKIVLKRK
ncbi:hypothetical protein R4J17_08805 [Brachyspira intermedia]|uniref:hypothetical protein n=1 Tax=Brachyspira intermedia TaxID=84377 RepID=UPI0030045C17